MPLIDDLSQFGLLWFYCVCVNSRQARNINRSAEKAVSCLPKIQRRKIHACAIKSNKLNSDKSSSYNTSNSVRYECPHEDFSIHTTIFILTLRLNLTIVFISFLVLRANFLSQNPSNVNRIWNNFLSSSINSLSKMLLGNIWKLGITISICNKRTSLELKNYPIISKFIIKVVQHYFGFLHFKNFSLIF